MSRRANSEGTVYKRKDGRWEGAAYVLTTDGSRKRKRVYGKTRMEANQKLVALIQQSQRGMPVASASQTLEEYLRYWLEQVARHRVRPLTFRTYAMYVHEHFIPGLGRKRLSQLSARDVRAFLNGKRQVQSRSPASGQRGLSPRTIFHMHAVLRNALENAVREDLVPRNVAKQVQVSPGHSKSVEPLSVEEAKALLSAAREDRLYALYAVALSLGLRRGEALGLRWQDVDLVKGVLTVRQTLQRHGGKLHFEPPKTKRSQRSIPLPRTCLVALREHREQQDEERAAAGSGWQDSELVFTTPHGTPLEPDDFSNAFPKMCDRAGIRRVRLHDLRHTCATLLLAQGVPPRVVMEVLGHSSLDVTMNIYGHVMLDAQREALGRMDDLFE